MLLSFLQRRILSPYLTVIGYVKMADGLGRQSVELIKTFKDDVRVSFHKTRGDREKSYEDVDSQIISLLNRKYKKPGKILIFEDYEYFNKPKIEKILTKIKDRKKHIFLAYTMFESTMAPKNWIEIFNEYFDAIVVPDPYQIEIFQSSGIKIPVFCLPLGLYLNEYMEQPLKREKNNPFIFANFSSFDPRKNHIGLVRAFAKAFGNSQDVLLKLNFRFNVFGTKEAVLEEINRLGLSNVKISGKSLPKKEYIEAFKDVDCYVNLSKGEGFSIQPREAMALGIPVIVTDNTSQHTIAQTKLVRAVPSKIQEPAYFPHIDQLCGFHFNFEVDDAAAALQDVYINYEKYLSHAKAARNWAKQYEFSNLKKYYRSLIMPAKIVLGEKNEITENYLMTNSKNLYEKYKNLSKSL
ncbi:MAG: hypothetical protein Tsb0015_07070 [Simkaniaceae bacterium]